MALAGPASESDGDKQLINKKQKKTCCECCASCCSSCTQCLSGFILLLAVAGLVLCARIFLEFPVILNGFRKTTNFTKESVETLMDETPNSPQSESPPKQITLNNETCKMFVGSFKFQYNTPANSSFQTASQHIQTLLNATLNNTSVLNESYRNASVFSIRPESSMAYFQLLFCKDSSSWSEIKADTVTQALRTYNISQQDGNISIDVKTVTMGEFAPCPLFSTAAQQWPWQVILQVNQTRVCIGSLLTSHWLVSSANCVNKGDILSLRINLESTWYNGTIAKIIQHPNFTVAPRYNNVALIRLSNPVWFSSSLTPLCLPQTTLDPATGSICNGSTADLSGAWLSNVPGTLSSEHTCSSESKTGILHFNPNTVIKIPAQMDTGNALVCMNTSDKTSYLQGIAPYSSNGSLLTDTCLSYASIGSAVDWIRSLILD